MKFQEISDKLTRFINKYNYLAEERSANVLFLLKCIVLKYLADNQHLDFEAHQKAIKKNFTLDYVLAIWQGRPLRHHSGGRSRQSLSLLGMRYGRGSLNLFSHPPHWREKIPA